MRGTTVERVQSENDTTGSKSPNAFEWFPSIRKKKQLFSIGLSPAFSDYTSISVMSAASSFQWVQGKLASSSKQGRELVLEGEVRQP